MYMMNILVALIMIIILVILIILNLISKKTFYDREKNSPFECGFDPKNINRLPFSLHFFLITLIFLIFDIEIALLLPFILTMLYSNIYLYTFTLSMFIIILIFGLLHEWVQGSLNWMN